MNQEARELINKVKDRVVHLGGYDAAFRHYDRKNEGRLDSGDIRRLLDDCRVGNWLTRGAWVSAIIAALDHDHDGNVSFLELESALKVPL